MNTRLRNGVPIAAAAVVAAILVILSYRGDESCTGKFGIDSRIDLLSGDLKANWSVFGALSPAQVNLAQTGPDAIAIEINGADPSWSQTSSGVKYSAGLFAPGWYEFTAEFQAETSDAEGMGAQLELHSDRWRYIVKPGRFERGEWKKINVRFRPADDDPVAEVSCRLWPGTRHSTGRVFLRGMYLTRIGGAPTGAGPRFDLEKQEEARLGKPHLLSNGGALGVMFTLLLLATVAGICWRLLGSLAPDTTGLTKASS